MNQATVTGAEEDTPLCRKELQQAVGVNFIAAATRQDRTRKPIVNFVQKRDWGSVK